MNAANFLPVNTFITAVGLDGLYSLRVTKDPAIKEFDEPTYARLAGVDFHDGVIEVRVLSRLLPDAPEYARGFIGVAFRIDEGNSSFESIYIRPTNGRNENQLRRNRSTQYFSYPDYKFDRLRAEFPGMYESYADMGLNEWIEIRIEVQGERASLTLNHAAQPTLIVNGLKHGADRRGGIGLWVEEGTEGFFTDLRVTARERVGALDNEEIYPL